jgi:hypothetical protein
MRQRLLYRSEDWRLLVMGVGAAAEANVRKASACADRDFLLNRQFANQPFGFLQGHIPVPDARSVGTRV